MTRAPDPRIFDAKRMTPRQVLDKLKASGLNERGGELVGPCPRCGGHDKPTRDSDRFALRLDDFLFNCRQCKISGNDQIGLVREVLQVGFLEALEVLCGERQAEISPEEQARRQKMLDDDAARQKDIALQKRKNARLAARKIWRSADEYKDRSVVRAYLEKRGITRALLPELPNSIRFHPNLPYWKFVDGATKLIHEGPAMVSLIQGRKDGGIGVHRTWVDLSQPSGKAKITFEGKDYDAKMCRGSQKSGAIRLHTPPAPFALVCGEGIETTFTVRVAMPIEVGGFNLTLDNTAFWAGINLDNMAGKMVKQKGTRHSGIPDLSDDDSFVPPAWCKLLVYLEDGDSAAKMTRAKLTAGLKRAAHFNPECQGFIVPAGAGRDHNDILKEGAGHG